MNAPQVADAPLATADSGMSSHDVFVRIGLLTRNLHDALRELGYDRAVGEAVSTLPDARARLTYIADLTGRAAERVLTAAETGRDIQNDLENAARALGERWGALDAEALPPAQRAAIGGTREFLVRVADDAQRTNSQLTEIMLAQDFHDLTGQVIQRVANLAQTLEEQLVKLLLDASPPEQRAKAGDTSVLAGPVINAQAAGDSVTNQSQVDDLLASLGF
ncbi:MAG: protein phosphatase CheZ [Betaproteobacteria bacterium]|nr:protein phosphatase CheZ [Betaproteobacteria bacterium]